MGWDARLLGNALCAKTLTCARRAAGKACYAHEPGFFRICWAWVDPAGLPVAVQRLEKVIAARKTPESTCTVT